MDIYNTLEGFSQEFSPNSYVLGGGMAVYLHTGLERESTDLDIILLDNDFEHVEAFIREHPGLKIDVARPGNYLASIAFEDDLLQEHTESISYRNESIPTLSKEALIASKITSLCLSDVQSPVTTYGLSVLRDKDIADVTALYSKGVDDKAIADVLDYVPHIEENDADVFARTIRTMFAQPLPEEILKNTFGVSRLASGQTDSSIDTVVEAVTNTLRGRDVGIIAHILDRAYTSLMCGDTLEEALGYEE